MTTQATDPIAVGAPAAPGPSGRPARTLRRRIGVRQALANALTLAWRLYADANRNLELADRTNADDPCFLPITGRVLAT